MRRAATAAALLLVGRLPVAVQTVMAAGLTPQASAASEPSGGAVRVSDATIPFSSFGSPQAKQAYSRLIKEPEATIGSDIKAVRRIQNEEADRLLREVSLRYRVLIRRESFGGVQTEIVIPAVGIAAKNRDRVLISLHGGAFMWGAGSEALLEAIPIAVTGRIEVVAVNYRMAPEHTFPAASQDVAAVYRALLERYRPQDIGIFGCSAGGILAAESVAWFAEHHIPEPGGIASLCGTGAELGGDSEYLASALRVGMSKPGGKPLQIRDLPYFKGIAEDDALAFPVNSPTLKQFPPTLLIAGSRDFTESSETVMQRRLWEAGIDSELFIFDGLWHAFMIHPNLPESREVYGIEWRFFDRHLGVAPNSATIGMGRSK
jgi:epsilon-lactone hydrolase